MNSHIQRRDSAPGIGIECANEFAPTGRHSAKVAPLLGQHNAQVLAQVAGYDAGRIADLTARGLLMSGDR